MREWMRYLVRSLRAGLYAHTAQALGARPVSAAIPNAAGAHGPLSEPLIFRIRGFP